MKIEYIGKGSYYHHPFLFNKDRNIQKVQENIGVTLLEQPKLFKEIPGSEEETKEDVVDEVKDNEEKTIKEEDKDTESEDKKKKTTKK